MIFQTIEVQQRFMSTCMMGRHHINCFHVNRIVHHKPAGEHIHISNSF